MRDLATGGLIVSPTSDPWRPVPRRRRCDRCSEGAAVILDDVHLCGECFLEESMRRYPPRLPPRSRRRSGPRNLE